jgi:hypothetical protein
MSLTRSAWYEAEDSPETSEYCLTIRRINTEMYKSLTAVLFNLLNPTGYVLHHQFNIQQLYILPTLYWFVLCSSESKQRIVPFIA